MFGGVPQSELDALEEFWKAFPGLRSALFTDNGTPYVQPKVDDLAEAIREHADVQGFTQQFSAAFADFNPWLRGELIDQMSEVSIQRQEPLIGEAIFQRLEPIPLIDKYHAYQLLDNEWQQIAIDLEILQTEGFEAAKVVDPNMVTKKKKGKDVEEQEGWKGHVLPFDLVQRLHHKDELAALQEKENRLTEIDASFEDTLESLSEEEKEAETVHESGDKWVNAVVKKEAKQLKAEARERQGASRRSSSSNEPAASASPLTDPESYEAKIIQVGDWLAEESKLNKAIKKDAAALHNKTKDTIENLSDDQVNELLEAKWILPLGESLHELPERQIEKLTEKVQALVEKYQTTNADNAREIQQTETELSGMIGQLEGNEFDMKGLAELTTFLGGGD